MDMYHSQIARTVASRGRNAAVRVPPAPKLRRRQGVVTAIFGGGKYASITLNNSTVVIPNVIVNPTYTPQVGDSCYVHLNGAGICDALVDSPVLNPDYTITL